MIHVLDFNDKIIDFLSTDDPSLVRAIHKRNVNDNSEMLELLISSERAEKFRERHRVIIRDSNKQWREFIINWVQDTMDGYTEIECIASYLADITTAKPYAPGKFEKKTTSEALKDVLSDTGWEVSEQTEYDGLRTTSWTSYQTRYEVLKQLCTTYKMVLDFYIELSSNTVKGRYVVLKKKNSLFKGKEIEYGKDLVGLTRKIDMSEIKTALIAVGPENDKGKRLELVVTDDEAQSQFNLPMRYIWGIYEPQSDDQNMNETRLSSLAKTELNKRKSAVMSYEITSTDLEVTYPHEIISIGDTVRVKHRDFNPPLYVEAEVIAEEYNIISENSTYTFGQPKEFKESELREEFNKRLNLIHQKLNDNISNINTIVKDVVDGELEYFERKIHKSDTPPENPVNDTLWYDTSNPDVAVLRRYWNGRWIEATPNDVEKLGGIIFTRLKDGHLRFRNNTAGGSLYMSHFGISTYIDGEGEDGGSSGTIQWWDKTYSDSGMNGITINSYGGVVALTSDNNRVVLESYASSNIKSKQAPVYLYPNTDKVPGLNRFAFTLSNADNAYSSDGYIMFGSDENYDYGAGIRFSKERNKGLVQIVNGRYATGGDTTIEAGYGKFNMLKRRDGNRYIHIQSTDLLSVGSDDAGDRIASNSIYRRTYSAAANLHITSAGTIGRSTSARKYKLSIENQYNDRDEQLEHSKAILNLPIRTWFDKAESEILARELREDRKLSEDTYKLDRYVGLIAEEVENLGLKEFVTYDDKGEIEGIAYDRLWIHLIPVIKEQQLRIKKLEESKNAG